MITNRSANADVLTVGIDVGGTSIRASVVDVDGQVLDTTQAPTPQSAQSLEDALDRVVRELVGRHNVAAVGLAVAGFVTSDHGIVLFAPHLPWVNAPVGKDLSRRLGLPVVLEHDANAAAYAEYRFGAAAGGRNVVTVAIGTGIGGALLIGGELYRGSYGVAPEFGHVQVVPDGRPCACGKRGCWERYCSGTALVDTAIELLAEDPTTSTVLAREVAVDPGGLTGRRIANAAYDGDPLALATMAEFTHWLAVGLAMVADAYDPDVVVIAGGVASSAPLFLDDAREQYATLLTGAKYRPLARIRTAQLGEAAGMVGAAALARSVVPDIISPARR